jgi:hypothetical protein
MARRPSRDKAEVLSEQDLKELRHNLTSAVSPFATFTNGPIRIVG